MVKINKNLILILIFLGQCTYCLSSEQSVGLKKITSFDNATVVVKKTPSVAVQTQVKKNSQPLPIQAKPIAQAQNVSPVQPQPVDFSLCNKTFKLDSQRLFYLTLASANANRFKIDEIQSKSGYVLFTVAKKQYLASVLTVSSQSSMLKITPCDNIYIFPVGIVQNMFKYIELNLNTPVEKLPVI